jgi:Flp pilus assembly protein TadG
MSFRDNMFDNSGASAVEFALVIPILIMMLCGILAYGGYFWMAHSVQEMANDSARAAIAGLDNGERESLARSSLSTGLAGSGLDPSLTKIQVDQNPNDLRVEVTYDASNTVFFALRGITPMPKPQIRRSAAIQLAGY